MSRSSFRILGIVPLWILAACAGLPIGTSMAPQSPVVVAPAPTERPMASDNARLQFIVRQREEARRVEAVGMLSLARQHWRYVLALAPDDEQANQEVKRLDAVIKTRLGAALAQGEASMMRGRTADARTAFLRALALDGSNDQARRRLIEIETRAAFALQDRKDARERAARNTGTEGPEDN